MDGGRGGVFHQQDSAGDGASVDSASALLHLRCTFLFGLFNQTHIPFSPPFLSLFSLAEAKWGIC